MRTDGTAIYQLKVTLKRIRPPIWRRLQVPGAITLAQLHRVLQEAMGWTDSHLHHFVIGGECYGRRDIEADFDVLNEARAKLAALVAPRQRFTYEYDFGDGWEHEILVEKAFEAGPDARYPVCTGGARACPPEDCGGAGGYARMLEVIADPADAAHDEMLEWLGGAFDPEAFNPQGVNAGLRRLRIGARRARAVEPEDLRP